MMTVSVYTCTISMYTSFLFLFLQGVVVSWQQSNYTAMEGSVLNVCAVQPAQTEKAFNITVVAPISEGL